MTEQETLEELFNKLITGPIEYFPAARGRLKAPSEKGVYVIYGPSDEVLHVGGTPRAKGGIAQRLRNHLATQSSFTSQYLNKDGLQLRNGYKFRCLCVSNPRLRALLEAYAGQSLPTAHWIRQIERRRRLGQRLPVPQK